MTHLTDMDLQRGLLREAKTPERCCRRSVQRGAQLLADCSWGSQVQALIDAGAMVYRDNGFGRTPLHWVQDRLPGGFEVLSTPLPRPPAWWFRGSLHPPPHLTYHSSLPPFFPWRSSDAGSSPPRCHVASKVLQANGRHLKCIDWIDWILCSKVTATR